ncbi:DUF3990 domain-containing protein [Paraburkholderia sediminicola]|uniref:DUF3990 domain-containing protein n=1 Tax=Paraburkholderia sediminicola TaxID=458836 RepID=UPI0038BE1018
MPAWKNGNLTVYHGTDNLQITGITRPLIPSQLPKSVPFKPNLAACRPFTDFGKGFYTTTSLHQAKQWANARVRRILAPHTGPQFAVVLGFEVDRDQLAALNALVFVRDTQDYWDFVQDCRLGFPPHQRSGVKQYYDVVYGPVALWPSQLLIQNCDQISFHMQAPSTPSTYLLKPEVVACATAPGGLF